MGGMAYLIARVIFVLLMIVVTSGVSMVFLGGLMEKHGLVTEGARRARLGGFIAASAACACVAAGPAMLAFIPDHIRSWLFETGGMAPAIAVSSAPRYDGVDRLPRRAGRPGGQTASSRLVCGPFPAGRFRALRLGCFHSPLLR